jgi:hypothetical protein
LPTRRNTEAINLHLAEIAKEIAAGRRATLLLNQAGWHLSAKLVVPENITLVPLPPKCPELNPTENIWQLIRDNWISNRIFKSYEAILDHCCFAWNKLIDMPWKIMSIGIRSARTAPKRTPAAVSRSISSSAISGSARAAGERIRGPELSPSGADRLSGFAAGTAAIRR